MIADRYQRAFLRILRTLPDMRHVLGSFVVNAGRLTWPSGRSTAYTIGVRNHAQCYSEQRA
jgi:hypothetical protein